MSTDYKKLIQQVTNSYKVAKKAGARAETLEKMKKDMNDLKDKEKNEKRYKDIREITNWPNDILVQRYDEAKKYANECEMRISDIDLLNSKEKENEIEMFNKALKIIEIIETEGRKREILCFLSDDEFTNTIKKIFGVVPQELSKEEIETYKKVPKNVLAYKVEGKKIKVLLRR